VREVRSYNRAQGTLQQEGSFLRESVTQVLSQMVGLAARR